jgi:hypothetical protein
MNRLRIPTFAAVAAGLALSAVVLTASGASAAPKCSSLNRQSLATARAMNAAMDAGNYADWSLYYEAWLNLEDQLDAAGC